MAHSMNDVNEAEPLNFDRYESQLTKLAKNKQLSGFAIATCEKEFQNLQTANQSTEKVAKEYEAINFTLKNAQSRDAGMLEKIKAKMSVHQAALDIETKKQDDIKAQIDKRKQDLQKVEGPIKKLMDDKIAMQKKLDQKTLDRCTKFLSKKSEDNVAFIMQSLVGILRGATTSEPVDVEIYLKKQDGLILALNRINFSAKTLPVDHFKTLIRDLIGKRALSLGIVTEVKKDDEPGGVSFEPNGQEFPQDLIDFLIFYKLLIIICKLCIAKHDEIRINEGINRKQVIADVINQDVESTQLKVDNLKKIMLHYEDDADLPSLQNTIESTCKEIETNRQGFHDQYAPDSNLKSATYKSVTNLNKTAESLEDFDTFFPAGTKSELCKCLTKEIWEEYKDMSCEEQVTFKTCIFSGIANLDSGIGVYAGSHNAYSKFNKLFDKVIQNYHGHGPLDQHESDMVSAGIQNAEFPEEDAKMVNSTRIRVGRNLAGYPLGPGVTKEQRLDIMNKVVQACETFEGDLKGTFYPLEGMSAEDQQQLIDDHFLFKEGDRFLKACNLNRDWPSGRGIFHNDAKTFLVWVNEEDQLRIISMQKGAGILEVFDRLCRAAAHIETICKFSHDSHLGYITSCPTNLGTALRASVHIKLPKLSKHKDQFQAIADKYFVQIRGTHGEHSESDDGTFDISNLRRLGRSEKQLVQDMIDGVQALIAAEKNLM